MMRKSLFLLSLVVTGIFLTALTSCGYFRSTVEERLYRARHTDKPIVIASAWPHALRKDQMWQGVKLAQREINSSGGIRGRKIKLLKRDDNASVNRGRVIAQKLVENPDVMAVIGHYNSYVSIPASSIYQFNNLLMVSPGSTNPDLTRRNYDYVFRTIPNDSQIGSQLAQYVDKEGDTRIGTLYASNSYGRGLADAFGREANQLNLNVVDRLSYDPNSTRYFERVINKWMQYQLDAVFLAGTMPQAARFIRQAGKMGLRLPIVGGDGLDSPDLWETAGKWANGTVAAAPFHHSQPQSDVKTFTRTFVETYGDTPDAWAAQGYDSLHLIAHAMKEARSPAPRDVQPILANLKSWDGVTGDHSFDKNGDVIGKEMIFKAMHNGRWQYIPEEQELQEITGSEGIPLSDTGTKRPVRNSVDTMTTFSTPPKTPATSADTLTQSGTESGLGSDVPRRSGEQPRSNPRTKPSEAPDTLSNDETNAPIP